MVHQGGLHLAPGPSRATPSAPRYQVLDESGQPVQARWPALRESISVRPLPGAVPPVAPDAARDEDPEWIAPTTGNAGFRLADCVDALCASVVTAAA